MNSLDVADIGMEISEKLKGYKLSKDCMLEIPLTENDFKKMDEDLYYRQHLDENEFVPSEDEIIVKFENLTIKFMKNGT